MRQITRRALLLALGACILGAGTASAQDWKLGIGMTRSPWGGVRIVSVFANSPAADLRLQPGQVILTVDGRLVNDPYAVRDYIMDPSRDSIVLVYQDGPAFYEVRADFAVVAAVPAYGSTRAGKAPARTYKKVKPGTVTRRRVSDPRFRR